jgi:hypothetical protein
VLEVVAPEGVVSRGLMGGAVVFCVYLRIDDYSAARSR